MGIRGEKKNQDTREQQKEKSVNSLWEGEIEKVWGEVKAVKGAVKNLPLRLPKLEGASSPLFNIKLGEGSYFMG